jgi:hypothetical protein
MGHLKYARYCPRGQRGKTTKMWFLRLNGLKASVEGWHGHRSNLVYNSKSQLQKKNVCKLDAVAHAYNYSYTGGRYGEDHGSRPGWVKS